MACANCGNGTSGSCGTSGGCTTGSCNKLEVFDWLANISLPSGQKPFDLVEVRFKNSRKAFYRNANNIGLQAGDVVVVESGTGRDVGVVSVCGELARIQVKAKAPHIKALETPKISRIAEQNDIDNWIKGRSLEKEVMYKARTLAVNQGLEMKISDVEYQADLTKATFYYTAEGRVDFRQLIKVMADQFRIRIEMRQIGARQEAARLGGIASCGRELCCSTWLSDFRSVSTSAARYQQLALNPQKLAGQCGKLKCCLNYELDSYLDAIKSFPKGDVRLRTEKGSAVHIKTDVFKREMWYAYEGDAGIGMGLIAIKPERVQEIIRMNKNGEKPLDLAAFVEPVEIKEPDYSNAVGQDSLNRFEHAFKNKGNKRRKKQGGRSENSGQASKSTEKTDQPKAQTNPNQATGERKNPRRKPRNRQNDKKDQP